MELKLINSDINIIKEVFMKKIIITLLLSIFILSNSFAQTQIHIAGIDGSDAVYWLNGRHTVLPKLGEWAQANAMEVSGSNIYIVGNDGFDAVYWLNGRRLILPRLGERAEANAIAVSGPNIYIVGYDDSEAVYWLNGKRTILPRSESKKSWARARANAIAVSGSNVYIAGLDDNGDDGCYAVYWLNGERIALPRNYEYGNGAKANAIAVSGSDVYVAGSNVFEVAYWLSGRLTVLPESGQLGGEAQRANAIAVSDSNVYIIGHGGGGGGVDTAGYWLNGRFIILPKSRNSPRDTTRFDTTANAIFVSGFNVYIAGSDGWNGYYDDVGFTGGTNAVYWLDERMIVLPKSGDIAKANAIVVVRN